MTELTLRWPDGGRTAERAFQPGDTVRIGRHPACEVALPAENRTVHREHAEIDWRDGRPVVTALGRNGVTVASHGAALREGESARLATSDRLQVGDLRIEVRLDETAGRNRELRCHHCGRLQAYKPEGMCIQCGFALAGADTVFVDR